MLRVPLLVVVIIITIICSAAIAQQTSDIVVNVALLQMMPSPTQNQTFNMIKAIEFCQEAAAGGADLALFPEMYNIGTIRFICKKTSFSKQVRLYNCIWRLRSIESNSALGVVGRRRLRRL